MSSIFKKVKSYIFSVKKLYKPGEPSLVKFDDIDIISSKMDFILK